LVVRFEKEFRQDFDNVKNLYVTLPSGDQISLDQLADVQIKAGPAQISRENTKRRITVGFNVRGRDVESIIKEVRAKIEKSIKLPPGYYVTYGGQFENLVAAKNRLAIAVPVALLLIFVLLFFTFHSFKQTMLIYSAVPLSAIGGVLALWLRDMNFSISAGVGFIALFGVSVLNGIVLIAEFNRLEKEEGITDTYERVLRGLKTRLRPVVMTAAVASIGFLPMALSNSAGAEVQKPLATVVIGGLISATLLTLIVLPVLYVIFSRNYGRKRRNTVSPILLILGFVSVSLLFTQNASAQHLSPRILTLQQAISLAVDSNLNVRSAAYQVELQRALKGASWDIGKTDIDFEYGQFNSAQKDNGITISQSFAFPTVYTGQHKLAKANIRGSEIELSITQNQIANGVKTTWWKLAYYYSKLRLLKYQDSLYTGFANAANRRAQTGETNMLEKISAESQSLEVRNLVMQTKADIEIYKKQLQTLLNTRQDIVIADTVLTKLSINIDTDSISVGANPSLASYQQQVEIARLESKVEKSRMLPDFTIGYFSQSIIGAQDVNGIPHSYTSSDRFTGVQAGISIPLWFYPQSAKIKAAKINHSIAKANAEYFKTALSGEFDAMLQEYRKYKNNIDYYEKLALPQADMIINQSTKSYRAGAMDYLAYIQSLSQALLIKNNYLESLDLYNQSVIAIEFIIGQK